MVPAPSTNRFARIDWQKKKKPIFITCERARIASNLRFAIFSPPLSAIRKKGVRFGNPEIRKILVSIKFVSAILGPETAAPILWTPGKNAFFLQEKPVSIKFLVLRGGGILGLGGRGEVPILFLWARGFF